MKATSLGLFAVVLLVPACSGFFATKAKTSSDSSIDSPTRAKVAVKEKSKPKLESWEDTAEPQGPTRSKLAVGDYFVERFTGSFRKTPLTLLEEVIAEEGELLVI